MMALAVASVALALFLICKMMYSSYCNPVSFYVIPWGLATLFAISGLYGIYVPADGTVALVVISMIAFALGCVFIHSVWQSRCRFGLARSTPLGSRVSTSIHFDFTLTLCARRLLYALGALAIAYELYLAARSIPLLLGGQGLDYIKYQYSNVEGTTLFSTRELLLFSWVSQPIIISIMMFFACELCSHRVNWAMFTFSIVGCALYITISGGRNLLFIFFCILLVTLILSSQIGGVIRWLHSLPKAVKFLAIALIIAMVFITEQRSLGHNASVLENVFFYLFGGITYFDQMLANSSMFDLLNGNYLLGWSTFGFIVNPILIVASVIFRFDYIGSDAILSDAASIYLPFNDTLRGNGLCTCLYAFIRDFGLPGVFLGPFLFGLMTGIVWERTFRSAIPNFKWFPICIYFMYCVLFSTWRYLLVFPGTAAVFMVIIAVNIMNRRAAASDARRSEVTGSKRIVDDRRPV